MGPLNKKRNIKIPCKDTKGTHDRGWFTWGECPPAAPTSAL